MQGLELGLGSAALPCPHRWGHQPPPKKNTFKPQNSSFYPILFSRGCWEVSPSDFWQGLEPGLSSVALPCSMKGAHRPRDIKPHQKICLNPKIHLFLQPYFLERCWEGSPSDFWQSLELGLSSVALPLQMGAHRPRDIIKPQNSPFSPVLFSRGCWEGSPSDFWQVWSWG